ncbi:sulfurtransferase [Hydrogenovibrio sp. JE_KL2]|uniref:sulfurtransferase n=1 Tax=Hydrogenovibrio sp. JE_KL2 TaxID=2651188 RepID=UPI0020A41525|nr:rhodanese-like domain-containing protein [Hydrogenovibrio sp. JE_KL2]
MFAKIFSSWFMLSLASFLPFSVHAAADPLRIDASTLVTAIEQHHQTAVVLDARSEALYQQDHIPGALNFPVNWTYAHKKTNGQVIEPNQAQALFRKLGLDIQTPVIIYDDGALVDAARLFWTLEVYGLQKVKVLSTGYDYWTNKGYPTTDRVPFATPSNYIAEVKHQRLATKFSTLLATKNPNDLIIDARPLPAYLGEQSSAKRFGHIPTAISIPASHNLKLENHMASFQPVNELEKVYSDIPKNKKVIIYCAIGRISATNYFALRELGYDVANYDASWKQWGNDLALPIVNPSFSKENGN